MNISWPFMEFPASIFLAAVDIWLANPRHYNVTRDIGELCLGVNEYENDLADDIQSAQAGYTLPETDKETQEDRAFIAREGSVDMKLEDNLDRLERNAEEEFRKQKGREKKLQTRKQKSPGKASRLQGTSVALKGAFGIVKQKVNKPLRKVTKAAKRKEQVGFYLHCFYLHTTH